MNSVSVVVALVLLAVVIVGIAYALGVYYRRREGLPAPNFPRPFPKLLGSSVEREEQAVTAWLCSQAFEQTGVKVADDKLAYQRIVDAARKAVHELKNQPEATISLPFLTADASGPKDFEITLTRDVLKELARY